MRQPVVFIVDPNIRRWPLRPSLFGASAHFFRAISPLLDVIEVIVFLTSAFAAPTFEHAEVSARSHVQHRSDQLEMPDNGKAISEMRSATSFMRHPLKRV